MTYIFSTDCRIGIRDSVALAVNIYKAFLSTTSDDSLKVMAVCVEEHYNGRGITIRVAANTGDLSAVTTRFIRLARALEHAVRRGWAINLLPTLC